MVVVWYYEEDAENHVYVAYSEELRQLLEFEFWSKQQQSMFELFA